MLELFLFTVAYLPQSQFFPHLNHTMIAKLRYSRKQGLALANTVIKCKINQFQCPCLATGHVIEREKTQSIYKWG